MPRDTPTSIRANLDKRVQTDETLPDDVRELRQEVEELRQVVMGLAAHLAIHLKACAGTSSPPVGEVTDINDRLMQVNWDSDE